MLVFSPVLPASAQSFQLDFDSVQTGVSEMSGGDFILEGGLTPLQTFGTADGGQIHPLGAPAYCGNGIKENGEACDGTSLGSATCQSNGFTQGSLSCTSSCTVSTAGCSNTVQTGGTGGSGGGDGGAGGGNGGGGRREIPVNNVQKPSQAGVPIPAVGLPPTGTVHRNARQRTGAPPTAALGNLAGVLPGQTATDPPLDGQAAPALSDAQATDSRSPMTSMANVVALGGVSLTEAGILARLAWIARLKSLYGVIPVFT